MTATKAPLPPNQVNYTIKEAAAFLRVSENSIRRLIARKLLRASKALRHVLLMGTDVESFMDRTSR